MNDLLKVADNYGPIHRIKFNPNETELMIFNYSIHRSSETKRLDDWKGEIMLSGNKTKLVSSMRYLGSWLNDKLTANTHIEKKCSAAFAVFNRIKKLGFNSVLTDCKLKGKLDLLNRIMLNAFTQELYGKLKKLRIINSYPLQIEKLLKPLGEITFHDWRAFTEEEKAKKLSSTLKTFAESQARKSTEISYINKIFKLNKKEMIPNLL